MLLFAVVDTIVVVLLILWLLKKKQGEKFSKKFVIKALGFGALAVIAGLLVGFVLPADGIPGIEDPLLSGIVTAFVLAALLEEVIKYLFFRLVLRINQEVKTWHDTVIACILVGMGFTVLENVEYALAGSANLLRVLFPCHLLFQFYMGYYYGKARVTKKPVYHVLSLLVPILWHTVFDMFIVAIQKAAGPGGIENLSASLTGKTTQELMADPKLASILVYGAGMMIVSLICLIFLIVSLHKVSKWSKQGKLQESIE